MKVERLFAMLIYMMHQKKVTAPQLATQFEVSVRTIYRDIETLEGAGIPIIAYPGKNGGYAIMEQFALSRFTFTNEEKNILLQGLSLQQAYFDSQSLESLTQKINLLNIDNNAQETYTFEHASMQPIALQNEIKQTIQQLSKSIAKGNQLHFTYITIKGITSQRNVYPKKLLYTYGSWYLEAYCLERKAMRQFKISRLTDITESHQIPPDFSFPTPEKSALQNARQSPLSATLSYPEAMLGVLYDYVPKNWIKREPDATVTITLPATNAENLIYHPILYFEGCNIISPKWLITAFQDIIEKRQKTL